MPKLITYAAFGLILFAAAAGASWYLQQRLASKPDAAPPPAAAGAPGSSPGDETPTSPALSADAEAEGKAQGDHGLPVAIRPRPVSTDEIFRYSASLANREKALQAREESYQQTRTQLNLREEDIRHERRILEALQTHVQGKIATAERLLSELAAKRQEAEQERRKAEQELKTIKEAQTEYKQSERDNLKRLSGIAQKMEPEKAAEYLRALSNEGKLEMAVQLLGNFEEREAAKILEALNDPALITQLTDKFRGLQRPNNKTITP